MYFISKYIRSAKQTKILICYIYTQTHTEFKKMHENAKKNIGTQHKTLIPCTWVHVF